MNNCSCNRDVNMEKDIEYRINIDPVTRYGYVYFYWEIVEVKKKYFITRLASDEEDSMEEAVKNSKNKYVELMKKMQK